MNNRVDLYFETKQALITLIIANRGLAMLSKSILSRIGVSMDSMTAEDISNMEVYFEQKGCPKEMLMPTMEMLFSVDWASIPCTNEGVEAMLEEDGTLSNLQAMTDEQLQAELESCKKGLADTTQASYMYLMIQNALGEG